MNLNYPMQFVELYRQHCDRFLDLAPGVLLGRLYAPHEVLGGSTATVKLQFTGSFTFKILSWLRVNTILNNR